MSALAMVAINGKPRRHEPSHAAALALRKLHKRFGDKSVLNGIDLAIEPGQFVAIVGKSGCGKSTLLRLIAGLDTPSAGKIEFDNKPSDGLRSDVRVMFQEPRLLPWATVQRNVEVGLLRSALNIGKSTTAYSALAEVGLSDRAGDWPAVLSGGQRQRVSLARALVSKPRLLALDEPLGALDALTRLEMQDLLERVWREQGFTALLVTHDVGEAIALADRVIVIEAGTVALDLHVDIPRPRRRHPEQLALLEEEVLRRLLAPVTPSTQNSPTHDSSPTHS